MTRCGNATTSELRAVLGSYGQGGGVLPRSGDVVRVTRRASVQFIQPFLFRIIRVHDWSTYYGWCWLDGYVLNAVGDAIQRRTIYIQPGGLEPRGVTPGRRST